ncbi:MAG: T9SS type A sorting domain-containing protein [Bacteroidota bacterium]
MRVNYTFFVLIMLLSGSLSAQTVYDLNFSNAESNGGQFCVDLNIGFDVAAGLATSNLVFTFNTNAIRNPSLSSHILSTPFVYQIPTVTQPIEGTASVNVVLNAATFGQAIGSTPTQLVRVCFDIETPNETVDLTWIVDENAATVVFMDQAIPQQLGPGTLLDFNGSNFPVEWLDFSAKRENQDARLSWTTASETNNSHFEVERAFAGQDFAVIGQVEGIGNSPEQTSYDFVDQAIVDLGEKKLVYRIKQVDLDGQFSYSPQVELNLNDVSGLLVTAFPNAFQDQLNVIYRSLEEEEIEISIVNLQGQEIWAADSKNERGEYQINTKNWPAGIYYLSLFTGSDKQVVKVLKL